MPRGYPLKLDVEAQMQCVLEGLRGTPISEVCRRYGMSQSQYYRFRDRFLEGGKTGLCGSDSNGQVQLLQGQIAELERTVGRLTVQNDVLRRTLK